MKLRLLVGGYAGVFMVSASLLACPYTFINDGKKTVFLAEKVTHGHLVMPGKQAGLEAPMNPEHEALHAEQGVQKQGEHEDSNGHAPFYVYVEMTPGTYDLLYKIRERACGKDSVVRFSDLESMATGKKDAGRFGIKKMTEERAEKKKKELAPVKAEDTAS